MAADWQVETLRISVFPHEIDTVSPSTIWDRHKGEPEPEIHIQPGSTNQRNAKHKNGEMYLVKTTRQIDWRYVLPLNVAANEDELPVWGDLELELTAFLQFSKDFLQNSTILPVDRLAFGAVLMKVERDVPSVYEYLGHLLPRFNLANVADFNYQINRQRKSSVLHELSINRFSRWQIATLERNISTLDPEEVEKYPLERLFAARLELDINSSPDSFSRLDSGLLAIAFEELVAMGLEIADEGDIE